MMNIEKRDRFKASELARSLALQLTVFCVWSAGGDYLHIRSWIRLISEFF